MDKRTMIVLDESGNEKEAEVLSAFSVKKYNKNYILYTLNEVDENSMVKIYASELIEKDNVTLLYVTHATKTAKDFCKRGMVMQTGNLIYDGDIEEAMQIYTETIKG